MRTALDTNILSAIWTGELAAPRILSGLTKASQEGALVISPAVYAESLAHPAFSESKVHEFLADTGIRVDWNLPEQVWTLAGLRYAAYARRRRKSAGDQPRRILADFLIGAHALLRADRLMTTDTERFSRDFPELNLYPL
ncbi:PIN domain-containing protein [Granulicella sp. 5B5]|uniref:type II toxin-antitoxin system VapC family toxin n=1 Tax=Granulicella sp. 5B5 TaxID=1617967 RepID=UPI0015F3E96D|nr:type II toxin-antitoxin system VapC family toxin [Granulicella sp. 5B5]QMV18867.1 PIN domain-containing protein [Granulicella sp. 5B5]